jgi:hypothetical protein
VRDLHGTFRVLRALLDPYASRLQVTADTETRYDLGGYVEEFKRPLVFGSVSVRRNFVSFHLMPVYSHPELIGRISDRLRRRMQGKSCFNFIQPDSELFAELSTIVDAGFKLYESIGWVK